jgi:hypothetical protein
MEKEFVPYELAVKLKELGFNEPCLVGYSTSTEKLEYYSRPIVTKDSFTVNAPTFYQAFRWFRKEHNLKFHIREDVWNNWCSLKMIRYDDYISIGEYKTYEEAEIGCLEKLIEIVEFNLNK